MKSRKESGIYNQCGKIIQKIRIKSGLSQEKLAGKMQLAGSEITQKAISRIEAQKRIVADYELFYFADALGITVYQLLGLEDNNL